MSESSETRGKLLQDLFLDWQELVRLRVQALPGSQARSGLDVVYFKTLPVILQITEVVDDSEVIRLVKVASSLLKERLPDGEIEGDIKKVLDIYPTSGRGQQRKKNSPIEIAKKGFESSQIRA